MLAVAHSFDEYRRYEEYPRRNEGNSLRQSHKYLKQNKERSRADNRIDEDVLDNFNSVRNYIDAVVNKKLKNHLRHSNKDTGNILSF